MPFIGHRHKGRRELNFFQWYKEAEANTNDPKSTLAFITELKIKRREERWLPQKVPVD